MAQTFKKGDLEVTLGNQIGDTGVFNTDLGDFSIADLISQGFTEFTPPAPIDTVTPVIEPVATTLDATAVDEVPTQAPTFDAEQLQTQIQESITQAGAGAIANEAFINAVARFALGRDASKDELSRIGTNKFGVLGAGVNDVLRRFGIAEQFGLLLDKPVVDTPGGVAEEAPTGIAEAPTPQSANEKIADLLSGLGEDLAGIKEQAREDVELDIKSQAIADAQIKVNNLRTQLANQQIIDISEQDVVRAKPILTSQIQGQLNNLSREQKLDLMITQNNYNNALVEGQIAQGNYDRAQAIVQETADDFYQNAQFQLDALEVQGKIESEEKASLESQLNFERELALGGYAPITREMADAQGLLSADLFTDPVSGKIYKRPDKQNEEINNWEYTRIGTDKDGNPTYGFVNPVTQEVSNDRPTSNSTGTVVGGYNISSYATDPNHEKNVAKILDGIGKFETAEQMQSYIDEKYPNSPVTAEMIQNTSAKFGIEWEMLVAMMAQDSSMGTAGKAVRTKNPGNVGNDDSGNLVSYANWEAGVDAVGNWLSKHKSTGTTPVDLGDFDTATNYVSAPENVNKTDEQLKSDLLSGVSSKDLKLNVTEINSIIANRPKAEEDIEPEEKFSKDWWNYMWGKADESGQSVDSYVQRWGEGGVKSEIIIEGLGYKGLDKDEIYDKILEYYDKDELNRQAKDAGFAIWGRGARKEIKDYIESIINK